MKADKIAFITGITGFAGSHLAELLLKKGYEVHGLCRWRSRTENIESIKRKIPFEKTLRDLLNYWRERI
ncbi:MAG TPA: GDP-mannose 4,6-dehydratase [Nevskiaceae bacterium]|nr:GDP-mannose 4,6-dehydratase [Nevskiaceae bacterium]